MKELREILEAVVRAAKQPAALATIVKAKGSTYRRAGARMLMTRAGERIGSISGGCLEGDAFERAKKVMETGRPVVVAYDTTSDDDLVWGLGLGCAGVVHVLIEPLQAESDAIKFLAECAARDRAGVLVTVFQPESRFARLAIRDDGQPAFHLEDRELEALILPDAAEALRSGRSNVKQYGEVEVFFESIQPAIPLFVFGAGHDAIPLVRFAKELGWNVTVVDSRPAYAKRERFPGASKVILSDPDDVPSRVQMESRSVAVIMTHNYAHDTKLLKALIPSAVRHISLLGPRKRTESLLQDLRKEGIEFSGDQLARLYGPAGIDLGAESPEEIALAILGEIQAVLSGRSGGLLRNRKGPIHDR